MAPAVAPLGAGITSNLRMACRLSMSPRIREIHQARPSGSCGLAISESALSQPQRVFAVGRGELHRERERARRLYLEAAGARRGSRRGRKGQQRRRHPPRRSSDRAARAGAPKVPCRCRRCGAAPPPSGRPRRTLPARRGRPAPCTWRSCTRAAETWRRSTRGRGVKQRPSPSARKTCPPSPSSCSQWSSALARSAGR
eukprot:scaffold133259_cov112-Phaeocystis_antarctica.AAC.2